MANNRYLNTALNTIYLYLLKGINGTGNGKVNKNWEIENGHQSAFDDFLDETNAEFSNDKDLLKMEILKKGFPSEQDRRGLYVYTDSNDQSLIKDWKDGVVYTSIYIQLRIRKEQSDYVWKYQDALIDYLNPENLDIVEPIGLIASSYNTENLDGFNGTIVRFDFVLDYLVDEE